MLIDSVSNEEIQKLKEVLSHYGIPVHVESYLSFSFTDKLNGLVIYKKHGRLKISHKFN